MFVKAPLDIFYNKSYINDPLAYLCNNKLYNAKKYLDRTTIISSTAALRHLRLLRNQGSRGMERAL